jgi:hypothetical protein
MKKHEIVYREIACAYVDGVRRFTQLGLSKKLGMSISTVNGAVSKLAGINAVRVKLRYFEVIDFERLLMFWTTHHSTAKEVVYSARVDMPVGKIEGSLPDGIAYTAYTAYRTLFGDAPADYSEVYLYATGKALEEIKRRFSGKAGAPNLFVLKTDELLKERIEKKELKRSSVCAAMAFVDTWNLKEWYSKEYADAYMKRLIE